jgi:hypothetical protein
MNFRFQNRRMKWRNTKERESFTSANNEKNDCYDYQQKEEIISVINHNNETKNSHIDKNN